MLRQVWNYRYTKAILSVLLVFILALVIRGENASEVTVLKEDKFPLVEVTTPLEYTDIGSLSLIGTVRAFTEAQITAEVGGRVTGVNAKLGQQVQAGQILVTIENASERAALLQAEGAYEAAQAAAASSVVGTREAEIRLNEAKNTLASTNNQVYSTLQSVLNNTIDTNFYVNPNGPYPSLVINALGDNVFLRNERRAFQDVLPVLQGFKTNEIDVDTLKENAEYATTQVERVLNVTDMFLAIVNAYQNNDEYTDADKARINSELNAARASLVNTLNSLEQNTLALGTAEEGLERAKIGASGGTVSASEAQLKQALGSLRAAEANYAKTILRTPISGTVNSLNVQSGDFISSFMNVAVVANNSALEIVTYVGDLERERLKVGDKVLIENNYEGTVTQIAPAVDSATRKTEVRIAAENSNIKNGDTVKLTNVSEENTGALKEIRVPLTAVKFEIEDGSIFTVNENKLVSVPVKLGSISGNSVVVLEGLSENDSFVIDARGLLAGTEVEIKN